MGAELSLAGITGVALARPDPASLLEGIRSGKTAERAVTVVMPALNEEANIAGAVAETIRAVADLDDYEILIINDGSTDRTAEIAEGLAREESPSPSYPQCLQYGFWRGLQGRCRQCANALRHHGAGRQQPPGRRHHADP